MTGFRGIGERAWLKLSPRPGVTLVVGRNGSGKTSFAAGLETAFTGTSTQWDGSHPESRGHWRNLHSGEAPRVEVKLCVEGDDRPGTLTRTWGGGEVTDSTASFKRPGHAACDLAEAGWTQEALVGYRPFLSYTDLGKTWCSTTPARRCAVKLFRSWRGSTRNGTAASSGSRGGSTGRDRRTPPSPG